MSARENLGALRRRGVLLFTREAAAVLHEVCVRLSEAQDEGRTLCAPAVEQLWVTSEGELVVAVEPASSGKNAPSTMQDLALLIEALLPPTIRDQPDYAVPGSFRVLAPRARGFPPGLPSIQTPAELAAAVARYRDGDTTLVLQQLFARTAVPALTPTETVATPVRTSEPEEQTPTDAPVALSEESDGGILAPESRDGLDLPLNTSEVASWVRPLPPSPAPGVFRSHRWIWLCAAVAVAMAFVVSYEVTRRLSARGELTAHAGEPALSAPEQPAGAPTNSSAPPTSPSPAVSGRRPADPRVSEDTRRISAPGDSERLNVPAPRPTPERIASLNPSANSRPAADTSESSSAQPTPLQMAASTGPVFSPSFAGSGSALLFHAGRNPDARLMSAEMRESSSPLEVVTIVSDGARNYHPRLSPDGRLMAFDSDREGERGIYVSNRDGTHVRRVSGAGFAIVPSWSPDMRALAFVRAETDRPQVWNLWRLDWATGALTRLTQHRYGQTWGASWFPDSRRVCYSHEDRLIVLDMTDGATRVFMSPRQGRLVRTPAVSPDGRLVAFQVMGDGVWLLDLDSGTMRRLIEDPSAEEFAWDPNGGRLAYHSRSSGEWRIWIAAAPRAATDVH